jgi:hypothetical protein
MRFVFMPPSLIAPAYKSIDFYAERSDYFFPRAPHRILRGGFICTAFCCRFELPRRGRASYHSPIVNKIYAATLLLIFALACPAAAEKPKRDGNWWLQLSVPEKAIYTTGMLDGAYTGVPLLELQGASKQASQYDRSVDKLQGRTPVSYWVGALDALYRDPANRAIPAPLAMFIVGHMHARFTRKQVQDYILDLRQKLLHRTR